MPQLDIDEFEAGMNSTTGPGKLPPAVARRVCGLSLNQNGRLIPTPAPVTLYAPTVAGGDTVRRFTRYYSPVKKRLMFGKYQPMAVGGPYWQIFQRDESGSGDSVLHQYTVSTTLGGRTVDPENVTFVQEGDFLFFTLPSARLQVWNGVSTDTRGVGVPAPTVAPTLTSVGGFIFGKLSTVDMPLEYLDYVITYYNGNGSESNPSPSERITGLIANKVDVGLPPPDPADVIAYDIQGYNIYRMGATIGDNFYRVDQVPLGPSTYRDNIPDGEVSTIAVSRQRFLPPTGLDILFSHGQRLFAASTTGAGESLGNTTLWFSGIAELESWPRGTENLETDGGNIKIPGADGILALSSTGSLLLVFKEQSVWTLYGTNFRNFRLSQRNEIGIVSKWAVCRGYNQCYYLGTDRRVYQVTDEGALAISEPIRRDLLAISMTDLATARMVFHDGKVILTFATGSASPNDIVYVFDVQTKAWTQQLGLYSADAGVFPSPTVPGRMDLLFLAYTGNTIKRAFADSTVERYICWRSAEFWGGDGPKTRGTSTSRIEYFQMEGTLTQGATQATRAKINLYADTNTFTYDLNATTNPTIGNYLPGVQASFRPSLDCVGEFLTFEVAGLVTGGEITRFGFEASLERTEG